MKKILIVDDEPNIVMALEYTFKKNNYEVFIARDGQEALDIVKLNFPDLIILDVMMPMVDGYATLEQIRNQENLKHTKVIFLSVSFFLISLINRLTLFSVFFIKACFNINI